MLENLNFENGSVYLGIIIAVIGYFYGLIKQLITGKSDEGIMFLGFSIIVPYVNIVILTVMTYLYLTKREKIRELYLKN